MPKTYDIGDNVICQVWFSDPDTKSPVDPTVVTFKYQEPDSSITTRIFPAAITKVATGHYKSTVAINAALTRPQGDWFYRWAGSGIAWPGAEEGYFMVRASHF